jgi:hypothetical protein
VHCNLQEQQQQDQQPWPDRTAQHGRAAPDACSSAATPADNGSCYACLHAPAAVLLQGQVCAMASSCMSCLANTNAAAVATACLASTRALLYAQQAGGCDVVVCLDPCSALHPLQNSSQTRHAGHRLNVSSCAAGVSGLLVSCSGSGVVHALSCLSEVVGSFSSDDGSAAS